MASRGVAVAQPENNVPLPDPPTNPNVGGGLPGLVSRLMLEPTRFGFWDAAMLSIVWKTFLHWVCGSVMLTDVYALPVAVIVPGLPAAPFPPGIQKPIWQGGEGLPAALVAELFLKNHYDGARLAGADRVRQYDRVNDCAIRFYDKYITPLLDCLGN